MANEPRAVCTLEPPAYTQKIVLRYKTGEGKQGELCTHNITIADGEVWHWLYRAGENRRVCSLLDLVSVEIRPVLVLAWSIEDVGTFYWLGRDNWTMDIHAAARFNYDEEIFPVVVALDRPGLVAVSL